MAAKNKIGFCPECNAEVKLFARGRCTKHYFRMIRAEKKKAQTIVKTDSEEMVKPEGWNMDDFVNQFMPPQFAAMVKDNA